MQTSGRCGVRPPDRLVDAQIWIFSCGALRSAPAPRPDWDHVRVLQLTPQIASSGGISTYVRSLTDELRVAGHECLVFSPDGEDSPDPAGVVHQVPEVRQAMTSSQIAPSLLDRIAKVEPDVVLVHYIRNGLLLERLMEAGLPVAEFVHGFACSGAKLFRRHDVVCSHPVGPRCLWDWYAGPCGSSKDPVVLLEDHRRAKAYLAALRNLPCVLVASNFMRDYLVGEGVSADRISVQEWSPHLWRQHRPEARSRNRAEHGPSGSNLLFVGRLVYAKGVQYLLEAVCQLDDRYRLRIAGDGWYRAALEVQSRRLGLSGRVSFLGDLAGKALDDEYVAADVVVVPSIWPEPLGLVVAEAAGYGCLVVASAVGGLPEWRDRGVAFEICAPGDPGALAVAIERACRAMNEEGGFAVATLGSESADGGAARERPSDQGPGPHRALVDELCRLGGSASCGGPG